MFHAWWRRGAAGDDEDGVCPSCATRLAVKPSLRIHYSTCCGRRLCTDCIERLFAQKRRARCPECHEENSRAHFVADSLEQQHRKTQVEVRARLRDTFNFTRADFESLDAFNDYLELVEDVVYDLTHGSDDDKAAANKRVEAFAREHEAAIGENNARRASRMEGVEEEDEEVAEDEGEERDGARLPPVLFVAPVAVPRPLPQGGGDSRKKKRKLSGRTKEAGGFRASFDAERCDQESRGSALTFVFE